MLSSRPIQDYRQRVTCVLNAQVPALVTAGYSLAGPQSLNVLIGKLQAILEPTKGICLWALPPITCRGMAELSTAVEGAG